MNNKPIIIIGTGLAGYNLAREFRKFDKNTRLQLFTVDKGRYYSKPVLSNSLTNKRETHEIALSNAEKMRAQLNAEIFTETQVDTINTKDEHILEAGRSHPYSKLVFACGASQIRPPFQGNGLNDVCSINNLIQYEQFREKLKPNQHIVIIGAGFIGCEFANDLNNVGYKVSVIAASSYPLDKFIPELAGRALQTALSNEGVDWYFEKRVTSINKINNKFEIKMSDGTKLYPDHVLMSVGLRANMQLAQTVGISTSKGITTNQFLETSAKNVYALGDCAQINGEMKQFVAPINCCVKSLAKTLVGNKTAVKFPHMLITVKTPACPIMIVNPCQHDDGHWQVEGNDLTTKALFYNHENVLKGFVLTGKGKELILTRAKLLRQLAKVA